MLHSPETILQMAKLPKSDSPTRKQEIPAEAEELKKEIQTIIKGRRLEDLSKAELKTVLLRHKELAKVLGITTEKKGEDLGIEKLNESIEPFLRETFTIWDSQEKADQAQITPSFQKPKNQDFQAKEKDIDPTKFGEYSLNPETQTLDFETAKVFVPDLSAFSGKKRSEVAKHIVDTYGDKYHIPGIEYWQWLIQNPDKTPNSKENLKDGRYNFFFGSFLRDSDGRWLVPDARWGGSAWDRDGSWLDAQWGGNARVVLLEKN